jgi:hypothetical protein
MMGGDRVAEGGSRLNLKSAEAEDASPDAENREFNHRRSLGVSSRSALV